MPDNVITMTGVCRCNATDIAALKTLYVNGDVITTSLIFDIADHGSLVS